MTVAEYIEAIHVALTNEFQFKSYGMDRELTLSDIGLAAMVISAIKSDAKYVCPQCYKPFRYDESQTDVCEGHPC